MLASAKCVLLCSFVVLCIAVKDRLTIESQVPRKSFAKGKRSDAYVVHELIFSVQQSNLDELDRILLKRSTPGDSEYQKWLTFDEVGTLTTNPKATRSVLDWLSTIAGVTVTWKSIRSEYIKAEAPIAVWENVLGTTFYEWHDQSQTRGIHNGDKVVHRALDYSLPVHMVPHIAAVFNTVQVPPEFKPKYRKKIGQGGDHFKTNLRVQPADTLADEPPGVVTIPFLNQLYKITSNTGNAQHQQSVFETAGEDFSPADLAQFQRTYHLPNQPVSSTFGHDTTDCVSHDCYEGNLDVQYMMGIAQQTATIYWYTSGNDPFIEWITDVANTRNPPLVNSISWGIVEQVPYNCSCVCLFLAFFASCSSTD